MSSLLCSQLGNHVWWEKTKINDTFMRCSKTLNVEITAYVLLTMILNGNDSECLPVFRWLLNQRNDLGGFEGTQDTIVGIEALANFAAKISTTTNNVKIDVATSSNKYIFDVNQDNALVLQSQKVCLHFYAQFVYSIVLCLCSLIVIVCLHS